MKNIAAKKKFIKSTARDAMGILLGEAEKNARTYPARTKRYTRMLWALLKKYKVRLTKEQKKKFCRKCLAFFIIDRTVKAIFDSRHNTFYLQCMNCGYKRRV